MSVRTKGARRGPRGERLRQAAAAGIHQAAHNLGLLLWREGSREGLEFFKRASDAGNADSSMNLGLLMEEIDADEALRYFKRAVARGRPDAQTHIDAIMSRRTSAPG